MQNLKAMSTADMLRLREDVTDELTRRLEGHMEAYLGDRDWYEETGDPFAYEEVAFAVIHDEAWSGPGECKFYTFKPKGDLFERRIDTPEELAEALYEACVAAHAKGIELARVGENVSWRERM